jgi:SAM-dependent methyltransferase
MAPTVLTMDRLHLGCGRNTLQGWINLDIIPGEGVDVVADLDACAETPLPFEDDSIEEFLGVHVLEHLHNPLPLMQELHRIAKPDARAYITVPYGSSDDAAEDPTHVRLYYLGSFSYFSQPTYWRADYGYRGDWLVEKIILRVSEKRYAGKSAAEIYEEVMHGRNVVVEMTGNLVAVKPAREPKQELIHRPQIDITLV